MIGTVFYLKGLVSASLIRLGECDVTNFALYTNVDKFVDWIENPTEELIVTQATVSVAKPSYSQLPSYGQAPPSYAKPQTSHEKPQASYEKPQSSYAKPNYGTQKPSYNVAPSYGTQSHSQKVPETCGVMSSVRSLIQSGTQSSRKQFPWTVAILLRQQSGIFTYFSTGTLISSKHIVTTGLSLAYLDESSQKYVARSSSDFRMYFGISSMDETNVAGAAFVDGVSKVYLHPDIKHGYPRIANIGILKLKESVRLGDFVLPACLPHNEVDLEEIEGRNAFAVGWGQDDTGSDSKTKNHVEVKVRSKIDCLYFWKDYLKSDDRKKFFCAGGEGRKTACYRDQPLYLKEDGKWTIIGLISIAQNLQNGKCDASTPVLYEDVGRYYDWIKDIIS